jgi:hypothetical protein
VTRNQIVIEDLVELINEHGGIDSFSRAMSQLTDRAMAIERADALRAEPYQRTDTRGGYANGSTHPPWARAAQNTTGSRRCQFLSLGVATFPGPSRRYTAKSIPKRTLFLAPLVRLLPNGPLQRGIFPLRTAVLDRLRIFSAASSKRLSAR